MPINPEAKSNWHPKTLISRGADRQHPAVVAFESLVANAIAGSDDQNVIVNSARPGFQRELVMPDVLDQLHEQALLEKLAREEAAQVVAPIVQSPAANQPSAADRFFAPYRRTDGTTDWDQVAKNTHYVVKGPPINQVTSELPGQLSEPAVDQIEKVM